MKAIAARWNTLMTNTAYRFAGHGLGALIGAAGGYLYWQQIGCSSGSCAITSDPVNSTLYGAMMGVLIINAMVPQKKKTDNGEA